MKEQIEFGRVAMRAVLDSLLAAKGVTPLRIETRCKQVGREEQYRTIYGLFCLDSHNNIAALADRHLEEKDGQVHVNFFAAPQSTGKSEQDKQRYLYHLSCKVLRSKEATSFAYNVYYVKSLIGRESVAGGSVLREQMSVASF